MKFEWNLNEIWMKFEWNLNEIWMKFEWNLNEIWMKFERNLDEIWMKFEWNLNEIWMKFEWNLDEIWMKFEWNLTFLETFQKNIEILNFTKTRLVGDKFFHLGGRIDRQDEDNTSFSAIWRKHQKWIR